MYSVARKGIIFFEARDSFVLQVAAYFNFTVNYEHSAVFYNDMTYGGVKNTSIPNYVYRWTEREVEKTIRSSYPYAEPEIHYRYASDFPRTLELRKNGGGRLLMVKVFWFLFSLFVKIFPKQQNLMACFIKKQELNILLYPWLEYDDGTIVFNKKWGLTQYNHLN